MAIKARARVGFTNTSYDGLRQGKPFTLYLLGCDGGCTIALLTGPPDDLEEVKVLTKNATGDSFTFTLNDLPSGDYAFRIESNEDGDTGYSAQFELDDDTLTDVTTTDSDEISSVSSETTAAVSSSTTLTTLATSLVPISASQVPPSNPSFLSGNTASATSIAPTASNLKTPNKSGDGLTPGALAGIVVGILAVVLLVLAGGFLWWRKRRQRKASGESTSIHDNSQPKVAELEQPKNLEGQIISKSPTSPAAAELAGRVTSSELPTSEPTNAKELEANPTVVAAEFHGEDKSPYSELPAEDTKYEMDGSEEAKAAQVRNPITEPAQEEPHSPSPSTVSPDTRVSIMPGPLDEATSPSLASQSPSPESGQTKAMLMDQFAQLEARRQRILELKKIEDEQAELQMQLSKIQEKGD
ncbi:extracellular matrix precursor [Fusarium albosuccineum]|uniref:Extracellular matrix n=1 Tax=Fusarium albosuccineum TaxID=1237068 RepID=A0A8H4L394_9HYPO|nr:extracellular matrix precursor [Fusarium albosuccineum]